jgi:hypothetical protein
MVDGLSWSMDAGRISDNRYQEARRKAYTEVTEDTEFAEKREARVRRRETSRARS